MNKVVTVFSLKEDSILKVRGQMNLLTSCRTFGKSDTETRMKRCPKCQESFERLPKVLSRIKRDEEGSALKWPRSHPLSQPKYLNRPLT